MIEFDDKVAARPRPLEEIDSDIADLVSSALHTIGYAMTTRIEHLEKSAAAAQALYEAGQADDTVKAEQDDSLVTNSGYWALAEASRWEARQVHEIIRKLHELADERAKS